MAWRLFTTCGEISTSMGFQQRFCSRRILVVFVMWLLSSTNIGFFTQIAFIVERFVNVGWRGWLECSGYGWGWERRSDGVGEMMWSVGVYG